jgi:uncharacterized membrane protein YdjX (TVP38/TMEM64 family)
VSALAAVLRRRYGSAEWDAVLRASGVVALLALYPTWRWPAVAGLVGFFCLTLLVSGPLTVVVPAMFEPMLMVAGRVYAPWLVAVVGVTGHAYMDYMNYHVFGAAIRHPRLEKARNSRVVGRLLALFQRSPFFVVWFGAWSPLPFWIVVTLASLSRYPKRRFMLASVLGRAPRIWFFASLGLWVPLSSQLLVTYVACAIVVGVAVVVLRRRKRLHDHVSSPVAPTGSLLVGVTQRGLEIGLRDPRERMSAISSGCGND